MNFAMQKEHTNSSLQFYHYFNAIAISEIFFSNIHINKKPYFGLSREEVTDRLSTLLPEMADSFYSKFWKYHSFM